MDLIHIENSLSHYLFRKFDLRVVLQVETSTSVSPYNVKDVGSDFSPGKWCRFLVSNA